jgi:hypothetical protein
VIGRMFEDWYFTYLTCTTIKMHINVNFLPRRHDVHISIDLCNARNFLNCNIWHVNTELICAGMKLKGIYSFSDGVIKVQ